MSHLYLYVGNFNPGRFFFRKKSSNSTLSERLQLILISGRRVVISNLVVGTFTVHIIAHARDEPV